MDRLNEKQAKEIVFQAQMMAYPNREVGKALKPLYTYIEQVEADLTALREANRWIPMSERKPTKEDASACGYILIKSPGGSIFTSGWDSAEIIAHSAYITHWRALSEKE